MNGTDGMDGTDETARDLRAVLEAIADEDGRAAAPTADRAAAERAMLTSRIRRQRIVRGSVTTVTAVAAAGVVGVLAAQGIGLGPDVAPAVDPGPSATAAPGPRESAPTVVDPTPVPDPAPDVTPAPEVTADPAPAPDPAPDPGPQGATEPVAPPATPAPTGGEATARRIFAQYMDALERRDTAAIDALTEPTRRPVEIPDYTVTGEPSCDYAEYAEPAGSAELACDVDVGPTHFMLRVSVTRAPDGQWWVDAGEFGVG